MGRIYRPVEVEHGNKKATTVAIIDTGADETVISGRLAHRVDSDLYVIFKAVCAPDTILEGKYADVRIKKPPEPAVGSYISLPTSGLVICTRRRTTSTGV